MTQRETDIVRALLDTLDKLDGTPVPEAVLHAAMFGKTLPPPTLSEFERALRQCDTKGWLIGLPSKVTDRNHWTMSDKGSAALIQLSR
jgi:hypothetical protein